MIDLLRIPAIDLVRSPLRTLLRIASLAAAVALLAAMLLFIGHSLQTMTAGAVQSVKVDWQGPVASEAAATRVAARVGAQRGVLAAEPVATAPFAGVMHVAPSVGTIRAGSGALLAVGPTYLRAFHTFRFLRGSLRPGEVVLDQQLAATLQAAPGEIVALSVGRPARAIRLRVSGIAVVGSADTLFQPLDPLLGPAPAQPPANVAVMPLATFAKRVQPALPPNVSATPTSTRTPGTRAAPSGKCRRRSVRRHRAGPRTPR